jgi:molybdopterin molybdotransferase
MIKSDQALKIILKNTKRLPKVQADLSHTLGHVLADDIISPIDFPPFSKSAMDGYALAKGDQSPDYRIVGEVAAGETYKKKIQKGTAVKIMTGAMIPPNTGQVVMKEHVRTISDNRIKIQKFSAKSNICRQGEDLRKGGKLYAAGDITTPVILSGLSFAGLKKINVIRQPSIGIMITGSELLRNGAKYQIGKIYDSNGPLLKSLLTQLGLTTITARRVKDSLALLKKNFRELLNKHDALFLTGGVSVGEYDYIYQLLQELSLIHI